MNVLAIESSCDETSVAIVVIDKNRLEVLSNVVFSQIDIHQKYGGVVPEIASRHHIEKITYVLEEAINQAGLTLKEINLIAVTETPGLVGSLMVGLNMAKTIAWAYDIPIVFVNHLYGHIYANYIESDFSFPLLALIVSGGHTELVLMKEHFSFQKLGETLDDAVGEAYDKVARVIGVGYPGGPIIDKLAEEGTPIYPLPRIRLAKDSYDFSFSGLKSAVINLNQKALEKNKTLNKYDLASSFQAAVVEVLVEKTIKAATEYQVKHVIIAGGVAANGALRKSMKEAVSKLDDVLLTVPMLKYCTDNAAMIAVAGYFQYLNEEKRQIDT